IHGKINRTIGAMEPMHATTDLWREIDRGSVRGRHVGSGEEHAARDVNVGKETLRLGEVPLHEKRFDAGAVDGAVRRENGVDRHELDGIFEIAADRRAGEKIGSEDQAGASTRVEKLRVRGFAGARAAAEERAKLPRAAAVGEGVA